MTFRTTSAIGFVVGFALFGSVTFIPLYLQIVKGHSATDSGLLMTPMMLGVLVTSTGRLPDLPLWALPRLSDRRHGDRGRRLYLLSTLEVATPTRSRPATCCCSVSASGS